MESNSTVAPTQDSNPTLPMSWWPRVIVILGAALMLLGGVLAIVHPEMMVSPHDRINGAVRIYAGYLASRNGAIGLLLLALLALGAWRALSQLIIMVALIQFFDVCMDCMEGRWTIVPGVLLIGIAFLFAARRMSGSPFWKRSAWE
ncbi:MAG TPA: hypothetical protein VIJ79_11955 [Acidobacteriaceae bacterium]